MDATLDCGVSHTIWVTLTSDLVCRIFDLISTIILSGAYLIYYLRGESQICCSMDTSLDADVWHTILGHCDLDL